MAGKADFTEEEWDALEKGVTGSGMLVSVAHRDFTDSFGEAKAIAKDLAANRENASQLVRELAEMHGTGFGLVASPKEVNEGTMASLAAAVAALTAKAPDELPAYRAFVLEVAQKVAEAKGGVQEEETAAIARITEALGTGLDRHARAEAGPAVRQPPPRCCYRCTRCNTCGRCGRRAWRRRRKRRGGASPCCACASRILPTTTIAVIATIWPPRTIRFTSTAGFQVASPFSMIQAPLGRAAIPKPAPAPDSARRPLHRRRPPPRTDTAGITVSPFFS